MDTVSKEYSQLIARFNGPTTTVQSKLLRVASYIGILYCNGFVSDVTLNSSLFVILDAQRKINSEVGA